MYIYAFKKKDIIYNLTVQSGCFNWPPRHVTVCTTASLGWNQIRQSLRIAPSSFTHVYIMEGTGGKQIPEPVPSTGLTVVYEPEAGHPIAE
jgi:hypothetical protein